MISSRQLAAIKRSRSRRIARLFVRAARLRAQGKEEMMMTLIADEFVSLGGVYIKFLQGVLLQHPLMKKWHTDDRYKIFEDVEPEPLDIAEFLFHELPAEKRSQLSTISKEPFAAGSFGQVYRATLRDGRLVIIKVLRPYSKTMLRHDLKLLGYISHILTGIITSWDTELKPMIRDFKRSTSAETDYVLEKEFAAITYQKYLGNPHLVIPETLEELCTENMIVQEFADGISLADVIRKYDKGLDIEQYVKNINGSNIDTQLENLGYELLLGLFHGFPVHGDPHPGNIRLLPDNKVSLIDFGISASPPKHPKAFYQLMKQYWLAESEGQLDPGMLFRYYIQYYAHDLYQSLRRISRYATEQLHESFDLNTAIEDLARTIFKEKVSPDQSDKDVRDVRAGTSLNKVVNANNRFGLIGRLDDVDMMRGWSTYVNVITKIGKRSLVPKVYARVMPEVKRELPELEQEDDSSEVSLSTALEIVMSWLERVAGKDMNLFQELVEKLRLREFSRGVAEVPIIPDEKTPANA